MKLIAFALLCLGVGAFTAISLKLGDPRAGVLYGSGWEPVALVSAEKIVTFEIPPTPSKENIDLAMKVYGIKVPNKINGPFYDSELTDRGNTTGHSFGFSTKTVTIGTPAFSSWALLASTLAHEIEVHCAQSFSAITILDFLFPKSWGTWISEREAYMYEVQNRKRFGLSPDEALHILSVMDYWFPENGPK